MHPTLPQHDPHPSARAQAIRAEAEHYRYAYDRFQDIALAAHIPEHDLPSLTWSASVGETVLRSMVNMGHVNQHVALQSTDHAGHVELLEFLNTVRRGGMNAIYKRYKDIVTQSPVKNVHADSISAFHRLYQTIPMPDRVAKVWQDDRQFAWMRIAGPNPMWLRQIRALPAKFPVSEDHFSRAMSAHRARGYTAADDTLAGALDEGRIFLLDFEALDGIPSGTYPHGRTKYVVPAIALFALARDSKTLLPMAIQCGQQGGLPIFVPGDSQWTTAKLAVQVADGNMHQAVVHLAWTHLVTEPVVLALRRTLAKNHPIYLLLNPHHEGTLFINDAAETMLTGPEGAVDSVMAPRSDAARKAAEGAVKSWSFVGSQPRNEIAARGLLSADVLPEYPYRDDALLLWDAIHAWVSDYVAIFYPSDAEVAADTELAAFFEEMAAPDGGRLTSIAEARATSSVAALVDALAHLIFIPSVQHAAVNFPQRDLMAFVLNQPLSAYAPPPDGSPIDDDEAALLASLPPLDIAEFQQVLGLLLGETHYTRLGHYPTTLFGNFAHDARVNAPLHAFQARLAAIEAQIEARNTKRWLAYPYLLPSKVPQSINI